MLMNKKYKIALEIRHYFIATHLLIDIEQIYSTILNPLVSHNDECIRYSVLYAII